ncbi:MAG: hypothetical protein F6K18_31610 [Okeania sp. SIO2C2]|uniref:UPF0175 family protein n=1 Tax=Okeania sp. SIO2C2 TaxID=2607787 RepID=UPI0013B8441E|nr:UPF0175 family protein [Okeania sp. SIO2C2]NEP90999.1 hypothetical protein [Okeania sp. SIO2C2]
MTQSISKPLTLQEFLQLPETKPAHEYINGEIIQKPMPKGRHIVEIVMMLFQQEKISLGKASELLGIHRMQFQKLISDRGICVHYDVAEFQEDLKTLQEEGWR